MTLFRGPEKCDLNQVTRIAVNTIAVLSMIALFIWQVCSSMLSLESHFKDVLIKINLL